MGAIGLVGFSIAFTISGLADHRTYIWVLGLLLLVSSACSVFVYFGTRAKNSG